MTDLPFTLPQASGATAEERLGRAALLATLNSMEVRKEFEDMAGQAVFIEAQDAQGNKKAAIDFGGLFALLGKLGPLIGTLLPIILSIFTGGFSPATIAALIQALLQILSPASRVALVASLQGAAQP